MRLGAHVETEKPGSGDGIGLFPTRETAWRLGSAGNQEISDIIAMGIQRNQDAVNLRGLMESFPGTTILGPRQCGKFTLAKALNPRHEFDLENPRELTKLQSPMLALENLEGSVIYPKMQSYDLDEKIRVIPLEMVVKVITGAN